MLEEAEILEICERAGDHAPAAEAAGAALTAFRTGQSSYTPRMLPAPSTPAMPWDRRAPEREGPSSAWALLPEDLAARGCPGRPEHVFARLQRVRTWRPDSLFLSREIRAWLEDHDRPLPARHRRAPPFRGRLHQARARALGRPPHRGRPHAPPARTTRGSPTACPARWAAPWGAPSAPPAPWASCAT